MVQDHAMSNESNVALVKWILSSDNYFVFLEINAYIAVWLWSLMTVRSVPQDVEIALALALANCVIWTSERVIARNFLSIIVCSMIDWSFSSLLHLASLCWNVNVFWLWRVKTNMDSVCGKEPACFISQ